MQAHGGLDLKSHHISRTLLQNQIYCYPPLLEQWTYEKFLGHVLVEERKTVEQSFAAAIVYQFDNDFKCHNRCINDATCRIYSKGSHQWIYKEMQ
jgi:hypothetical protein